ncbi:unnamed protein product [Moneuplotes crassus]|uniref:Uncharacterized protein n=1 Tax=Euplotes crassus TaxID=5936 RepID=A0AAD1Y5N2_EUPCR|nr:unnamed protein product [Moneuplotes crassus]
MDSLVFPLSFLGLAFLATLLLFRGGSDAKDAICNCRKQSYVELINKLVRVFIHTSVLVSLLVVGYLQGCFSVNVSVLESISAVDRV